MEPEGCEVGLAVGIKSDDLSIKEHLYGDSLLKALELRIPGGHVVARSGSRSDAPWARLHEGAKAVPLDLERLLIAIRAKWTCGHKHRPWGHHSLIVLNGGPIV